MKRIDNAPVYSVFEEVYRHGRTEDKAPAKGHIDVCNDDIAKARAFAFGLVAERMNILNKSKNEQALPSDALEEFRTWAIEDGYDKDIELVQEVRAGFEKPFRQFNSDDDVVWTVEVTFGEDAQHNILVYDSDEDSGAAIEGLLSEAIFLSDRVD